MKLFTVIIFTLLLLTVPLTECIAHTDTDLDRKISVVCTVFPQYDWVRQIIGDNASNFDLILLLNNRLDLHNFQPSVDDIVKISTCDLFIYVGGTSDGWVKNTLKVATNPNMVVINLLDVLGEAVKTEKIIEGMEYPHDHDDDNDDDHHHEDEYDEHVWLSLKNAAPLCKAIADALSSLDTDNAEEYKNNLTAYIQKLSALDAEYQLAVSEAPVRTLLFGDRFPFRYLMDDYGLSYYAAFSGCSAETEASFETIIYLSKKVDELSLNTVMVTESANQLIARTIVNNTTSKNQRILVLDSMQSVTLSDVQNGATYLSIMENNLNTLKEALK